MNKKQRAEHYEGMAALNTLDQKTAGQCADAQLRIAVLSCADAAIDITNRDRARAFVAILSGYLAEIGESDLAKKMTALLDGRSA